MTTQTTRLPEPLLEEDITRFTQLPIKYPTLHTAYENHESMFWTAKEIDYQAYCSLKCYHKDPASPNRQYGPSNSMSKEINKEKVRVGILRYIKSKGCGSYKYIIGKNEKEILDKVEQVKNIEIKRHCEICGYVVDGYCKDLNIVFEIDELYHKYTKEKDNKREKIIRDKLNCKFIRINDYGDKK